jgi:hypothetical protein
MNLFSWLSRQPWDLSSIFGVFAWAFNGVAASMHMFKDVERRNKYLAELVGYSSLKEVYQGSVLPSCKTSHPV